MASSRKSSLTDHVAEHLAPHLPKHSHILIGLSGGIDSVVLLHLLHTAAPRFGWRLSALHVHHGISPNANAWAEFCAGLCARYGIRLHVERVDIAPLRDEHGIEAAARKLRQAAFAAQDCDFVALAHHADDQAETLLLQLLRGAGVKGAAAMPVLSKVEGPFIKAGQPIIVRPLLGIARTELEAYARQYGLSWVEDESNADDSYPRNFLRHRVLPLLAERFPAWRETLPRSAGHFAEAAELQEELARIDAQGAVAGGSLDIAVLLKLSVARARNLLRYFLHVQGAPMPQAVQLESILSQLLGARGDASVRVEYGGWEVRRFRGRVHVLRTLAGFDRGYSLVWQGEDELFWPALGARIGFRQVVGQGISLAKLRSGKVELRLRSGGESLRPRNGAATRSLKNLLQEHRVPPWQRERMPLLYCGEELVCVPGVAVAAGFQASASEPGIVPGWAAGQGHGGQTLLESRPQNFLISNHNLERNMAVERTLSIIKPDAVAKNVIGKIYSRFESNGLKIVASQMRHLSRAEAEGFYAVHKARPFFKDLVDFMISGPVMIQVLEGDNAVQKNRDLMGATDPKKAEKGTIRADFADSIDANAVHGSDSAENAKIEIDYFFAPKNIHSR
ncbi:MAG: nucleoside-diphosphate kinase [Nitrosomonadales bacterium]|nr:nucleoside-diphosphate kinase [Nitrosomonadales bacterium]